MKRLRPALATAGAAASALTLSSCMIFNPIQTAAPYNPGDGVPAASGVVQARNLAVIAEYKGAPGNLTGSVLNTSDNATLVRFATRADADSGAAPGKAISLQGREQVSITDVTFPAVTAGPGQLLDIVMVTSAGQTLVTVPVLLPTGHYEDSKPASTSASTASATPAATAAAPTTAPAG